MRSDQTPKANQKQNIIQIQHLLASKHIFGNKSNFTKTVIIIGDGVHFALGVLNFYTDETLVTMQRL